MERKACFHKGVMARMVCGLFRCQARVSCGLEVISAPKLPYNRDVCTVVWWAQGSCHDGTRQAEGLSNKVKRYNQHFNVHLLINFMGLSLQHFLNSHFKPCWFLLILNQKFQFISVHLLRQAGPKTIHFNSCWMRPKKDFPLKLSNYTCKHTVSVVSIVKKTYLLQ